MHAAIPSHSPSQKTVNSFSEYFGVMILSILHHVLLPTQPSLRPLRVTAGSAALAAISVRRESGSKATNTSMPRTIFCLRRIMALGLQMVHIRSLTFKNIFHRGNKAYTLAQKNLVSSVYS